jgi:hypothetical protein
VVGENGASIFLGEEMPHISKGGKYIFGWSRIRKNGLVQIPNEAVREYHLRPNEKVILISGSKASGGFVVAKKTYIQQSELADILTMNPELAKFHLEEGKTIRYKGRLYCWVTMYDDGQVILPSTTLKTFDIKAGDCLLSIRGSNIAFVMGAKGPIIEKARQHPEIKIFD